MQLDHMRRHPDGAIDTQFYRKGAGRMRAEAMRELMTSRTMRRVRGVAVATIAIAAAGALIGLSGVRCCGASAELAASQTVAPR